MPKIQTDGALRLARIPAKWNHFAEWNRAKSISWSKSLSPKSSTLAGFALTEGIAFLLASALAMTATGWLILAAGTACLADGPHLTLAAPLVMALVGVVMAGPALELRDPVRRRLGIVFGAQLSVLFAPTSLLALQPRRPQRPARIPAKWIGSL